ncbi:MAG: DUF3800 domain-containing protein [Actinobacteria bacterium]|nr:DUF3800 domain-containing protein [Actinomycetota bacterium]
MPKEWRVAFDESGFTGGNLLDADQPIFSLASILEAEEIERSLVQTAVPAPSPEFKFVVLERSGPGRRKLLDILSMPILTADVATVSVLHKPFVVVSKIVDLLIEPAYHLKGLDFYEGDRHLAYAELLYHQGPALDNESWIGLVRAFVDAIRNKSVVSLEAFLSHLGHLQGLAEREIHQVLMEIPTTVPKLQDLLLTDEGSLDQLDLSMTALLQQCQRWSARLPRFAVLHDQSKAIDRWKIYAERLMDPDSPKWTMHVGTKEVTYPLGATGIQFAESASSWSIQIADLLAGAGRRWAMGKNDVNSRDSLWKAIGETRLPNLIHHLVWP